MKKYISPNITVSFFNIDNIITASGTAPTLINKGDNGVPEAASFGSMFGDK